MPRLSKGLILHGIRKYNGTEEAELHITGSQAKQKGLSVTSMAERKSRSGTSAIWQSWQSESAEAEFHIFGKSECSLGNRTSDLWQSRQSRSAEAELHIFGSPSRAEMRKWTFTSLEELVEKLRKRNLRFFRSPGRTEVWKAEFHIFANQSRAEVWKRSFRPLEVLAEQKCGSWNLDSWMTTYLGKSCSYGFQRVPFVNCRQFMYLVTSLLVLRAGCGIGLYQFLIIAYVFTFHIFDSQGRTEEQKRTFTSSEELADTKCGT